MHLHRYASTECVLAQAALLSVALIGSCTLDTNPASGATTHEESIRVRDAGPIFEPELRIDAGAEDDAQEDAGSLGEAEPQPGSCDPNPCSNRAACEARGAGFECICDAGFHGALCEQTCGDGARTGREVCDDGADNGRAGYCDVDCARLVEDLVLLNPPSGEVVSNPIFFDWELRSRNPYTRYCTMLITDGDATPEDRRGEQAFYVGLESEAIVTLSARRYRGAFSFAVISVACDDPEATCAAPACVSGSLCPLPCEGRSIVSQSRSLRAVRP